MNYDVNKLKNFKGTFHVVDRDHGLPLGGGTTVKLLSLKTEPYTVTQYFPDKVTGKREPVPQPPDHHPLRITAVVELTAEVTVLGGASGNDYRVCSVCGAKPKLDADSLWFIMRNHDGDRLCFPVAEDEEEERDSYPVTGWVKDRDSGELLCDECAAEVDAAKEAIKAKRRKK